MEEYKKQHGMKTLNCLVNLFYIRSILDIQNCFEYIIKKHKTLTDKPTVENCVKGTHINLDIILISWHLRL